MKRNIGQAAKAAGGLVAWGAFLAAGHVYLAAIVVDDWQRATRKKVKTWLSR